MSASNLDERVRPPVGAAWIAGVSASIGLTAAGVVVLSAAGVLVGRGITVAVATLTVALAVGFAVGIVLILLVGSVTRDLLEGHVRRGALGGSAAFAAVILAASAMEGFGRLRVATIALLVVGGLMYRAIAAATLWAAAALLRALRRLGWRAGRPRQQRVDGAAFLIGMMTLAIVVNAVEFRAIDERTPHNYRAWHVYETIDVVDVAISQQISARRWVAPFVLLGKLFPGAEVVLPPGHFSTWFTFSEAARSFGGVREVRRASLDYTPLVDLDELELFRVSVDHLLSGSPARRVVNERVAFYAPSQPSGTLVIVAPDGSPGREGFFAFVDVLLLREEARAMVGS